MRFSLIKYTAMLLLAAVCIITACKKKNNVPNDGIDYATFTQNFHFAEMIFFDAVTLAELVLDTTVVNTLPIGCGTVTRTDTSATIDFGPTNCLCIDGHYRRGKISIKKSMYYEYRIEDTTRHVEISFSNYYRDSTAVHGPIGYRYLGNRYGGLNFDCYGDLTFVKPNGTSINSPGSGTIVWTTGYNTPSNWQDDTYNVSIKTGNPGNVQYYSMQEPCIISHTCKWIQAGSVFFVLPGDQTRIINFGKTPQCDNKVTYETYTGAILANISIVQ